MTRRRRLLHLGNNINILKTLDENSIDSVVTDPPYGLKFMNKKWDHDVPSVEFWKEVFRVLKPGGHVLSFGGTRTYHRMVVNIEDSGFEIRDQIMWLYGSGFPKSHNISKGIDKKFGLVDETKGFNVAGQGIGLNPDKTKRSDHPEYVKPVGITDQAKQWEGFGTALKPANEPIVLARKPLSEKTIVDNVLKHGTGALNIDGCRIQTNEKISYSTSQKRGVTDFSTGTSKQNTNGRWPANVILDEAAGEMLDEQSGNLGKSQGGNSTNVGSNISFQTDYSESEGRGKACGFGDSGGASRFFYCAKASKKERNAGLEGLEEKNVLFNDTRFKNNGDGTIRPITKTQNHHPTVKPIKLMEYLIKLITPPGGVVLDPFMGSGSTGIAAKKLGFDFVGMEIDEDYFKIAKTRINKTKKKQ